jgi:hypothetical protein
VHRTYTQTTRSFGRRRRDAVLGVRHCATQDPIPFTRTGLLRVVEQ